MFVRPIEGYDALQKSVRIMSCKFTLLNVRENVQRLIRITRQMFNLSTFTLRVSSLLKTLGGLW